MRSHPGALGAERQRRSESPPAYSPRRWRVLSVALLGVAIHRIDVTIVNVALPAIREDLGASAAEVEWVVAAYPFAFAVALITGGRLGDVFGRRRLFLVGIGGFTAASLVCGLAPSAAVLIGARVLQGVMAALMVPQVIAMIRVLFPSSERPRALGLFASVAGIANVGGPLAGGLLVQANPLDLGWRPIFLVNLPVGLFTFVAALALLRESRAQQRPRLDLVGAGLMTIALLLVLYPLIQGSEQGWPAWAFASFGGSAVTLVAFVAHQRWRERRGETPLVPLGLFRGRAFSTGLLAGLVFFSGASSLFLVLTITLQVGRGFSPLQTALTFLPCPLGLAGASAVSTRKAPQLGRALTAGGSLTVATGMALILLAADRAGEGFSGFALAPGLLLVGLGMGMVGPRLMAVVLAGVPERDAGSASGTLNTAFQIGGATGVAVIGLIFFGPLPEGQALASAPTGAFGAALRHSLLFEVGVYVLSALLMLLLPPRTGAQQGTSVDGDQAGPVSRAPARVSLSPAGRVGDNRRRV